MTETYFELRYGDGSVSRLDGITTGAGAKGVARQMRKLTNDTVDLYRVQHVDVDAPPRSRNTATSQ